MKWSEEAWNSIRDILNDILEHPFLKEMGCGSLDRAIFRRYLGQDSIYLANYAKALSAFASLVEDTQAKELVMSFVQNSMDAEKQMHGLLQERFGCVGEDAPSPVTIDYRDSEMRAVESGNAALALAALLPCEWVYSHVGMELFKRSSLEGNPYREWIEAYATEEFSSGVTMLIELADKWAAESTPQIRAAMTAAFKEATLLEYRFWDYAYKGWN